LFTLDFVLAMYYNHNPYFYVSFVDTHFVPCLLQSIDKFYIHSGGSLE